MAMCLCFSQSYGKVLEADKYGHDASVCAAIDISRCVRVSEDTFFHNARDHLF